MSALDQLLLKTYRETVKGHSSPIDLASVEADVDESHEAEPATVEPNPETAEPESATVEPNPETAEAESATVEPASESEGDSKFAVDNPDEAIIVAATPLSLEIFDDLSSDVAVDFADDHDIVDDATDVLPDADMEMRYELVSEVAESDQVRCADFGPGEDEAEAPTAPLAAFKPEWEVDRFSWPGLCTQLGERLDSELDDAIQQLQRDCEARQKKVLVASSRRGVGRTTLALCLARRAAQRGMRVLLVDLDYENPRLMACLGVSAEAGLERLAEERLTPESICISAVDDGVDLLPMKEPTEYSPWPWPDMARVLGVVAEHYDLVLLDTPPGDRLQTMLQDAQPPLDLGAVIVQDGRESSAQESGALAARLLANDVWLAGIVENFAA